MAAAGRPQHRRRSCRQHVGDLLDMPRGQRRRHSPSERTEREWVTRARKLLGTSVLFADAAMDST
ncbi:hypothetical protein [Nocardia sp. CA-120079]|uniref:hypothetical protein n=1 Tax=Nocardia sp. CA-120079 TaxID=3239974 RepID=UPI003D995829